MHKIESSAKRENIFENSWSHYEQFARQKGIKLIKFVIFFFALNYTKVHFQMKKINFVKETKILRRKEQTTQKNIVLKHLFEIFFKFMIIYLQFSFDKKVIKLKISQVHNRMHSKDLTLMNINNNSRGNHKSNLFDLVTINKYFEFLIIKTANIHCFA